MSIFQVTLFLGLLSIAAGMAGFSLISQGQLGPEYQRTDVTVEKIDWPEVELHAGDKTWTVERWVPLPWWKKGERISIWVAEGAAPVPEFGPYHPLLLMLYGFLTVMVSALILFSRPRAPEESDASAPHVLMWPVELKENHLYAWLIMGLAAGLAGWVIYDWNYPAADAPRFDAAADLGRLALAAAMIIGGCYWLSRKITATPEEIAETGLLGARSVQLSSVKTARFEIIRSTDSKRKQISSQIVLRDEKGETLMSLSRSLEPDETREAFYQYLLKRFPD